MCSCGRRCRCGSSCGCGRGCGRGRGRGWGHRYRQSILTYTLSLLHRELLRTPPARVGFARITHAHVCHTTIRTYSQNLFGARERFTFKYTVHIVTHQLTLLGPYLDRSEWTERVRPSSSHQVFKVRLVFRKSEPRWRDSEG